MKLRLTQTALVVLSLVALPLYVAPGCDASAERTTFETGGNGGNNPNGPSSSGVGGEGGTIFTGPGGGGGSGNAGSGVDPTTCAEAAMYRTYIGCDFWPTPVSNQVWSIFDFAVVVANAGDQPADVTVTRGGAAVATATVAPNDLTKIYLPWIPELKGADFDACTSVNQVLTSSLRVQNGSYHLVSSRPVTVYQFNALEYGPQGGPPGKNWNACPAQNCFQFNVPCFSFSNDASLLLPSTAMTGNYRVASYRGWMQANMGSYFAVTGTQNGTNVQLKVSGKGQVLGGNGINATGPNGLVNFTLDEGEVVEVVNGGTADPAGSLVYADKPVQVIAGIPCVYIPDNKGACDHLEESVVPIETLGKHYFVTVPTSPKGAPVGHVVRLIGNVNGTQLSYPGTLPNNAPLSINEGQVVDLGTVSKDFEIVGDHEFSVVTFQLGSSVVDPGTGSNAKGDPAQSTSTAVEQYRTKYVFLAPDDYTVNYVDIIQPLSAIVTLDGANVSAPVNPISSNYGIARVTLGAGNNGAHLLTSTEAVGIQVVGYGTATSYQYPGGMNLRTIAPPPPPPN